MSDAWDWAKDAVTPDKGTAATPKIQGAQYNAPGYSSADAMGRYERDAVHYQPGVEMSQPLQEIKDRAQARGDQGQQLLNSYGTNANTYGINASQYGGKAYDSGQLGQGIGTSAYQSATQSGQQLAQAGGMGGAAGEAYANQLKSTAGAAGGIAGGAQGQIAENRGAMMGAAGRLANLEGNQGPSAAQAQLMNATNRGQMANLAMARSGGGFGGSASRSSQALRQNAAMGQDAANQSAMLKAGEDAAWRQRQAANLGAAGGLYGGAGNLGATSGQLGLAGNAQTLQGQQAAGQMALAGNEQRMQGIGQGAQVALAGANAGMQGTQQGMQGAQLGIAGNQAGIQGATAGGQLAQAGLNAGFAGDTMAGQAIAQDQAAKQAYENMLTQQMGIQSGVSVGNAQAQNAFTGAMIGAGTSALPLLMAGSDRANKNVGREVKMSSELYGNPYGRRGAPGHLTPGSEDYYSTEPEMQPSQRDSIDKQKAMQALGNTMGAMASGMGKGGQYQSMAPQSVAYRPNGFGEFQPMVSDEKQKKAPDLRDVKSYEYEYKDPSIPGAAPGSQVGPMAGEIQQAIPGAVHDTPTGKIVDPGRVILPLLSVAGEQQKRIDDLEERLNSEPDRRLAENYYSPKGGRPKLSFESYDNLGLTKGTPNRAMVQDVRSDVQGAPADDASWFDRWNTEKANAAARNPAVSSDRRRLERQEAEEIRAKDPRAGSAISPLARRAIIGAANTALLPYRGARAVSGDRLPELKAEDAYADAESLYRGESTAATRERQSVEDAAHPMARDYGDAIGMVADPLLAAEAMKGGLRLGGYVGKAAPAEHGLLAAQSGAVRTGPNAPPVYTIDSAAQDLAKRTLGTKIDTKTAQRLVGDADTLGEGAYYSVIHVPEKNAVRIEARGGESTVMNNKTGKPMRVPGIVIDREYYRDQAGKLVANHDVFRIAEEMQGKGIGSSALQQQVKEYDRIGVDKIETLAADKGRYVWPRYGFELKHPQDFRQVRARFDEYLAEKGIDPASVPAANVHEIAKWRGDGASGKEYLTGPTAPQMTLQVDLRGPSGEVVRSELGLGKAERGKASRAASSSASQRASLSRSKSSERLDVGRSVADGDMPKSSTFPRLLGGP